MIGAASWTRRQLAAWTGMTLPEAITGTVWIVVLADTSRPNGGGVYAGAAILAGGVLALGLTMEGIVESFLAGRVRVGRSAAYAVLEVFAWTQFSIFAAAGFWGRTGVGAGTVVLWGLLTTLHAAEGRERGEPLRIRHAINGGVEAVGVATAWVIHSAYGPAATLLAFVILIGVEHGSRLSDVASRR